LQNDVASSRVPSPEGDKACLFATIGPENIGGIALSGHTDVVPVDGQTWDSDPFILRTAEGRLYGRGTCDMKGFVACVLAAVPDFKRRKLKTPIHIAFSYDEEIGCLGVRPMIAQFGTTLPMPRLTIVGEPTSMRVVDAHKGPVRWQVEVTGRAVHSSMAHLGVNAVTYGTRLVAELERIEADLKITARDERFEPPYATLQVTKFEGGTATNIVPVTCCFSFDVRSVPGVNIEAIERRFRAFADTVCLPEMQAIANEAAITITRANSVPAFAVDATSEIVALTLKLAEANKTHAVSYATEAGLFQNAGSQAIVCGPGDIAQAHTANEWVAASEISNCMAFLRRLGDWAET
jgi:acetylornithine deacetylase